MTLTGPSVIVLAGPNGAGKSTVAPALLQGALAVLNYVNADVVAQGLAGYTPEAAALAAGRIVRRRLRELAERRADFAFETTLAAKTLVRWLGELVDSRYNLHVVFVWLPSAEVAVQRVAERVDHGGHNVPEATIRRRYEQGLRNFAELYRPLASAWRVYDNTDADGPTIVAEGTGDATTVADPARWEIVRSSFGFRR